MRAICVEEFFLKRAYSVEVTLPPESDTRKLKDEIAVYCANADVLMQSPRSYWHYDTMHGGTLIAYADGVYLQGFDAGERALIQQAMTAYTPQSGRVLHIPAREQV